MQINVGSPSSETQCPRGEGGLPIPSQKEIHLRILFVLKYKWKFCRVRVRLDWYNRDNEVAIYKYNEKNGEHDKSHRISKAP